MTVHIRVEKPELLMYPVDIPVGHCMKHKESETIYFISYLYSGINNRRYITLNKQTPICFTPAQINASKCWIDLGPIKTD